jgi:hypothetical protein
VREREEERKEGERKVNEREVKRERGWKRE